MARIARIVIPSVPHHVTQCGNRRQTVFFGEDDYLAYLGLLTEHAGKAGERTGRPLGDAAFAARLEAASPDRNRRSGSTRTSRRD